MELGKKVMNNVTILELKGNSQAAPIIQALDQELRGAISLDNLKVLLDVGTLEFVDSSTLEALVTYQKKFKQVNATLAMANATPYIKKVLEIVRLDQFPYYDDMDTAMKAVRSRRR